MSTSKHTREKPAVKTDTTVPSIRPDAPIEDMPTTDPSVIKHEEFELEQFIRNPEDIGKGLVDAVAAMSSYSVKVRGKITMEFESMFKPRSNRIHVDASYSVKDFDKADNPQFFYKKITDGAPFTYNNVRKQIMTGDKAFVETARFKSLKDEIHKKAVEDADKTIRKVLEEAKEALEKAYDNDPTTKEGSKNNKPSQGDQEYVNSKDWYAITKDAARKGIRGLQYGSAELINNRGRTRNMVDLEKPEEVDAGRKRSATMFSKHNDLIFIVGFSTLVLATIWQTGMVQLLFNKPAKQIYDEQVKDERRRRDDQGSLPESTSNVRFDDVTSSSQSSVTPQSSYERSSSIADISTEKIRNELRKRDQERKLLD